MDLLFYYLSAVICLIVIVQSRAATGCKRVIKIPLGDDNIAPEVCDPCDVSTIVCPSCNCFLVFLFLSGPAEAILLSSGVCVSVCEREREMLLDSNTKVTWRAGDLFIERSYTV